MFSRTLAASVALWLGSFSLGQVAGDGQAAGVERFLIQQDGRYGYIDTTGKVVIPPIYQVAQEFHETRALFGRGEPGTYGFLDPAGREVIPMQFSANAFFSEGLALVEVNPARERGKEQLGFIDPGGTWVIRPDRTRFKWAGHFQAGLAVATSEKTGEKRGFIDRKGTWAIAPRFDWAEPFSEGLAAVDLGGKRGFVDPAGRFVIPATFLEAHSFSGGLALVYREPGHALFIDPAGKVMIDTHVDSAGAFTDQWSLVVAGGKTGYMDKAGAFAIPPKYEQAAPFSEDLAAVRIGSNWGFINRKDELLISARFEATRAGAPGPFRSGLARVYSRIPDFAEMDASPMAGLEFGYINIKGEYIWRPAHR